MDARRASRESRAHQEPQVPQAVRACRDTTVALVHLAQQDPLVPLDRSVRRDHWAHLAPLDLLDIRYYIYCQLYLTGQSQSFQFKML